MRFSRTTLALAATAACALVPAAASPAATPGPNDAQWIPGTSEYQLGMSCFGGDVTYNNPNTTSKVMYWGKPNATYPAIGDKYYVQLQTTALGRTCPYGISDVATELGLPEGTALAIDLRSSDANDRVRCFHIGSDGKETEVTNMTWSYPPTNPTTRGSWCDSTKVPGRGAYGGFYLGGRMLSAGTSFVIRVPVVSTKPLKGMAGAGDTTKAWSAITSGVNTMAVPYQWVTVADRAPAVSYPATPTTKIGDTTATTSGVADVWFRKGNLSVELGTVASGGYATVAGPFAIDGASARYTIDQDWGDLTPGTDYQWRVRFVDERGVATVGATRTFRTTGTAPAPGGGGTPGPKPGGGTTGGTGGGTGDGGTPGGGTGGGASGEPPREEPPAGGGGGTPVDGGATPVGGGAPSTGPVASAAGGAATAPRGTGISAPVATLAKGASLRALVGKGAGLDVTCAGACTVRATLKVDAKTARRLRLGAKAAVIATGSGTSARAGKLTLKLRATKAAAKRLKRAASVKATLTVTVPGVPATTRTVTLKR